MTALEPRRDGRPPGDRLDHAVVVALGLAAAALAIAGLTSQRLGVPAALWVAAGGAVPLSLGMLLIAAERSRHGRESERVKRRETATVLAEKLHEARERAESLGESTEMKDDVGSVPYPTDAVGEPVLAVVPDLVDESNDDSDAPEPVAPECSSIDRVAQLEETIVDLNRQVDELTKVVRGTTTPGPRRSARAGRHSGPPEMAEKAQKAQMAQMAQMAGTTETTGEPA